MANVKVKYLGVVRSITGKESEELAAESLGNLMNAIANRYEKFQYYLSERESSDRSLIITHNGLSVGYVKDYERRLKDGDIITLMTVIGGG